MDLSPLPRENARHPVEEPADGAEDEPGEMEEVEAEEEARAEKETDKGGNACGGVPGQEYICQVIHSQLTRSRAILTHLC